MKQLRDDIFFQSQQPKPMSTMIWVSSIRNAGNKTKSWQLKTSITPEKTESWRKEHEKTVAKIRGKIERGKQKREKERTFGTKGRQLNEKKNPKNSRKIPILEKELKGERNPEKKTAEKKGKN